MKLAITALIVACASPAYAHDVASDTCDANALILRDQTVRLAVLEAKYDEAMRFAEQANTAALRGDNTARAFRLAAYTAGFTIGAVGGGLTSSEMTSKPGLIAAGTAIGAVLGTAFVLVVDQVFLK